MDTRQCVGIVLRRIRGGVKGEGGNIKRERCTQGKGIVLRRGVKGEGGNIKRERWTQGNV